MQERSRKRENPEHWIFLLLLDPPKEGRPKKKMQPWQHLLTFSM